ncbi:unnamed protein product [Rotaria sp. Silwood1]|nr:unnamed protein product [Rotaria sp. Silwood1]
MKFLLEQPTYPLYNNQERIRLFQDNELLDDKDSPSSIETLQSVLEKTFFTNKISNSIHNNDFINKSDNFSTNHFVSTISHNQFNTNCSLLSKRIQKYSLSNHSTMAITAITSFSEEQTNSFDYDNTYLYPEDINKLDDISSLTTITSHLPMELNAIEQDTSVYSDMTSFRSDIDDISESITFDVQQNNITSDMQNLNVKNEDENIMPTNLNLTPSNCEFSGLVYARKCTVIKEDENDDDYDEQTLSLYDNVDYYSEQNNKIRSHADNVSLNSSMTSSMQDDHCPMTFTGEQQNKHGKKRTNEQEEEEEDDEDEDEDDYFIVYQQKTVDQLTMMNSENEIEIEEEEEEGYDHDDEHFESTKLVDNGQHDGILSDESQYSDDLRYSLDTAQNSCTNDDHNNTSSTLRQEAISITKVRCKQRKNWIHSSSTVNNNSRNFIKPFSLNNHGKNK